MKLIQYTGFYTAPTPAINPISITSLNGGATPYNSQPSVAVVGSGFGTQQGTVLYNSYSMVITSWADTQIAVEWADLPFNPNYADTDFGTSRTLSVVEGASSASVSSSTVVNPAAYYGVVTSAPTGSIYSNDVGIEFGVDKGYIRVLTGTIDTIDVGTGVVSGASVGSSIEYNIFDISTGSWANPVVETFLDTT